LFRNQPRSYDIFLLDLIFTSKFDMLIQ